jgi:hypothetical protein
MGYLAVGDTNSDSACSLSASLTRGRYVYVGPPCIITATPAASRISCNRALYSIALPLVFELSDLVCTTVAEQATLTPRR